ARDHVGAIALTREQAEHREIGVGLGRERDVRGADILQRIAEDAGVALQRGARIDIDGGADGFGDGGQRNVLGVERAVPEFEMIHGEAYPVGGRSKRSSSRRSERLRISSLRSGRAWASGVTRSSEV